MQVKKQQLELVMEQQTVSKLGKEYVKAVYCHPACLTYMQSTSCKTPGWMKHKLEFAGRNTNNLRYTDDTTLWQKMKRNWRVSWKWEESEKVGLNLNIQNTKIMASSPISSV